MKIGNWKVTDQAIEWSGKEFQRFVIERQSLLETSQPEDAEVPLYNILLQAMETDWLTADELYDLNFAFVFAAGSWQQPLDYDTLDNTMEYQYILLDEEEETQP